MGLPHKDLELDIVGDAAEGVDEVAAEGRHGGDDGHGDQRRDKAVFDGGGTGLVANQRTNKVRHERNSGLGSAKIIKLMGENRKKYREKTEE